MVSLYDIFIFLFIINLALFVCRSSVLKTGGVESEKNVLIVDVANMYFGWAHESNSNKHQIAQDKLISGYINFMSDHYNKFILVNDINNSSVNYVIKNYKYYDNSKNIYAEIISQKSWDNIYKFVENHFNSSISVAEDYSVIPYDIWKSASNHHVKGCDDYLCFLLARQYKKKQVNATIMSDDKYKDFLKFGNVPPFEATVVSMINKKINITKQHISPHPNSLGQIKDYKLISITLTYSFNDKKFSKVSTYNIPKPGTVWT